MFLTGARMKSRPLHLLVVDDHDAQRRLVAHMLASLGAAQVLQADSIDAALALVQRTPGLDAVLSDLDMPGGDGLELARRVRATGLPVAVALMSAIPPPVLAGIRALQAEGSALIHDVLPKPVSRDALARWLDQVRQTVPHGPPEAPFSVGAIEDAVAAKEIQPWFEPQVDLASGALTGFEVLARWQHPQRGVLSPARFIPVVESTPALIPLTLSLLDQALAVLPGLQRVAPGARLSVNVGMRCLETDGFADRAAAVMRDHALDPARVTLEVTESASMIDAERVVSTLTRLRMRGFELAVDDFGTGFGSLRQVAYGAYSEIKIDRQFVAGVCDDPMARAAVSSICALAGGLRMRCVAEGIETAAVRDAVAALGCGIGQGWWWARALPLSGVEDWAAQHAARVSETRRGRGPGGGERNL